MAEEGNSESEPRPVIKVLLVEDHALTRMGLKTALKRTPDISVIGEAANGEESVSCVDDLNPDVILMDVGMPVMDGIQATRKILAKSPTRKIIMLTQHDNDRDILASLAAGASGYCLKDVAPDRLYTAIRAVNAGDAWLDASIAGRVLKHYSDEARMASDEEIQKSEEPAVPPKAKEAPAKNRAAEAQDVIDRPFAEPLSARELEVLKLIVDGLSNQEIADKLIISLATAKTHVRNILNKLAVDDRTQAAVHAMRRGLV
jgi:DNA-binding NarL/FixJ family response regulator